MSSLSPSARKPSAPWLPSCTTRGCLRPGQRNCLQQSCLLASPGLQQRRQHTNSRRRQRCPQLEEIGALRTVCLHAVGPACAPVGNACTDHELLNRAHRIAEDGRCGEVTHLKGKRRQYSMLELSDEDEASTAAEPPPPPTTAQLPSKADRKAEKQLRKKQQEEAATATEEEPVLMEKRRKRAWEEDPGNCCRNWGHHSRHSRHAMQSAAANCAAVNMLAAPPPVKLAAKQAAA